MATNSPRSTVSVTPSSAPPRWSRRRSASPRCVSSRTGCIRCSSGQWAAAGSLALVQPARSDSARPRGRPAPGPARGSVSSGSPASAAFAARRSRGAPGAARTRAVRWAVTTCERLVAPPAAASSTLAIRSSPGRGVVGRALGEPAGQRPAAGGGDGVDVLAVVLGAAGPGHQAVPLQAGEGRVHLPDVERPHPARVRLERALELVAVHVVVVEEGEQPQPHGHIRSMHTRYASVSTSQFGASAEPSTPREALAQRPTSAPRTPGRGGGRGRPPAWPPPRRRTQPATPTSARRGRPPPGGRPARPDAAGTPGPRRPPGPPAPCGARRPGVEPGRAEGGAPGAPAPPCCAGTTRRPRPRWRTGPARPRRRRSPARRAAPASSRGAARSRVRYRPAPALRPRTGCGPTAPPAQPPGRRPAAAGRCSATSRHMHRSKRPSGGSGVARSQGRNRRTSRRPGRT